MKMSKVDNIGTETGSVVAKGDDFLSRLNQTISNFRQLMEMANKLKGQSQKPILDTRGNNPDTGQDTISNPPAPTGGNWQQMLNALVNSRYGDMPIGDIIQELSPHTLKQLRGFAQNATRLKK